MDEAKQCKVAEWRTPRDYGDVLRFVGLVEYLAHFLPDLASYVAPLTGMCRNDRPFAWQPIHEKCFAMIKALVAKSNVLKPINASLPERIWVITDASVSGIGAVLGQGNDWRTCRPVHWRARDAGNPRGPAQVGR